jgi:UDP-N-acetylglucosamine acyltransferase
MSRVSKDIPPYVKAVGNPVKLYGLNSVGLQRSGFPDNVVSELKKAYRLFCRSDVNITQALERAAKDLQPFPEVQAFIAFVEESGRGVVT